MEINAPKETLLECLQKVIGATAARTTSPIHSDVLLRPNEHGGLAMTAANSEFQIRADCAVDTPPKLLTTAPARKLLDILRLLRPQEAVNMNIKKDRIFLAAGNSKFTLMTQDPGEFTLIGEKPDEKEEGRVVSYRLNTAAQMLGALKMVYYAAAQKHSHRMYFNGVLMEFEPGAAGIALAATDGNRLAINRAPAELLSDGLKAAPPKKAKKKRAAADDDDDDDDGSGRLEAILPREPVAELLHNLDPNLGLEIDLSRRYARFRMPGYELATSVIDESYPDYRSVIPRNNEKIVVFERERFLASLNRVSVLCDREINNAVVFNLKKGQVKMQCENRNGEESTDEMPLNYEGDDLEIGFNFQLLKEMLMAVDFSAMRMAIRDASGSVLFEPMQEDTEDESVKSEFQYIVMPIRL